MDFPTTTKVGRVIPKEKFYTKTTVNTKLRQMFVDEIDKIVWTNKIAPETLNITAKHYAELQVFEITLKGSTISSQVLKHIDTFIPYPILFILKHTGATKAVMGYKEPNLNNQNQMKTDAYYETSWQPTINLEIKGRSVDEIYKNFLHQINPDLQKTSQPDLKTSVVHLKQQAVIKKQIDALNRKIANEPSVAKRQELARERHKLEQQP